MTAPFNAETWLIQLIIAVLSDWDAEFERMPLVTQVANARDVLERLKDNLAAIQAPTSSC